MEPGNSRSGCLETVRRQQVSSETALVIHGDQPLDLVALETQGHRPAHARQHHDIVQLANHALDPQPVSHVAAPHLDHLQPAACLRPAAGQLAAAGFETLVRDSVDDKAARALGIALGWDKPSVNMKLEEDLLALVPVARKKPLAGRH